MRLAASALALATGGALLATLLGAPPALAAADTPGPSITGYAAVPTTVSVSHGSADALLDVRIKDSDGAGHAGAGFDHGTVTLLTSSSTIGPTTFDTADLVGGTATDGSYDIKVSVPQGTAAGSYTASFSLVDTQGNSATATATNSPLTVTSMPETAPPALDGTVTASPAAIDVTRGGQDVTYAAHLTDAGAGVTDASITLRDPAGATTGIDLGQTAGTAHDGRWTGTQSFAPTDPAGAWTVLGLVAHDADGNTLSRSTGLGGTETVTQLADTTGPVLASARPVTATADATSGDATVTVAVRATDNLSGVTYGDVEFTSPDGTGSASGHFDGAPATGTILDGTWNVAVTIPARSPGGLWQLTSASVTDAQGNDTFYDAGHAPPAAGIQVTATADTTAPTLSAFTVGPAQAPIVSGAARVVGRFTVNDATSGFASATISFQGPDGTVNDVNTVSLTDPSQYALTGTTRSGTVSFVGYLTGSATGSWTVAGVTITDLEGNSRSYATSDLGSATRITAVAGTADSLAPVLTSLAISPATVDSTTGDQPVTVRLAAGDGTAAASGIASATVDLASTTGGGTLHFEFNGDLPVAGDYEAGSYADTEIVGRFAPAGTWKVTGVSLWDEQQNERDYGPADLGTALGGSAPALLVRSATDNTAPRAAAVTTPATADVTGGDPVTVHVVAGDNTGGSGLASASVTLTGPGGSTATGTSDPDAATASGVDAAVYLPRYNSSGSWTVSGVNVVDNSGNTRSYGAGDVAALGGAHAVAVTGTADVTSPSAAGLAIAPRPVDTTAASLDVDVLVRLTDTVSGLDHASVTLTGPSGAHAVVAGLALVAGDSDDGWWQGTASFPRYSQTGTWTATLSATDGAGNQRTVDPASLGGAGTLAVTGPPDTDTPTLGALTVTPTTSDTTRSAQDVTFAATAADATSGVASVSLAITDPADHPHPVTLTRTDDGTATSATLAGHLLVPISAAPGAWTIDQATVTDRFGHSASYTTAQLRTAGYAASFITTGSVDTTAPVLASLTLDTATVTAPATVTGTATVTDNASGFASGSLVFTGPHGQRVVGYLGAAMMTAGTVNAASVPVSFTVAAETPADTLTLSAATLVDAAGNTAQYDTTTLPAGAPTLTVTAAAPPTTTGPSPTPATPAPKPVATTLTNAHVTAAVTYGHKILVTGTLTRNDTKRGVAGLWVRLQYRHRGSKGAFATWATAARTSSSGSVSFTGFAPGYTAEIRLTYATSAAYGAATSSSRTAWVRRGISAYAASSVKRRQRFSVHGTVAPGTSGKHVYLQQWYSGRWHNVARLTLHSRSYSFSVKRTSGGTVSYRVATAADSWYLAAVSVVRKVRVR